jgi:hypothetical protein
MMDMESGAEHLVGGDTLPELPDGGGTQEVGRLRGEAEKDLTEEVVIIERITPLRRHRGRSAVLAVAASHIAITMWSGDFGVEPSRVSQTISLVGRKDGYLPLFLIETWRCVSHWYLKLFQLLERTVRETFISN